MRLPSFITGGDRVSNAKDEIERLDEKFKKRNKLGSRDKISYKKAQQIISKQRQKIAVLLGGSFVAATGLLYYWLSQYHEVNSKGKTVQNSSYPEPDETKPEKYLYYSPEDNQFYNFSDVDLARIASASGMNIDELESRTQILIEKIEDGYSRFEQKLMPFIDKIDDAFLKKHLKHSFELFQINQRDNTFNANIISLIKERDKIDRSSEQFHIKHPGLFFFSIRPPMPVQKTQGGDLSVAIAGFLNQSRTMLISEQFDPDNPLHLLILSHELRHAVSDLFIRGKLTPEGKQEYQDFFSPNPSVRYRKPHVVIEEEAAGIGDEIEFLNLLLEGNLCAGKYSDSDQDVHELLIKLGVEENQIHFSYIKSLLNYAGLYCPEGLNPDGPVNSRFFEAVKKDYSGQNIAVYDSLPFAIQKYFR